MKIIQRRSLGPQPVYDLGLAQDHNFVVQGGLVASNCFNKSHSTAYGYVTYQTAYLKANYPVEYMAALLTSNSGDQDKMPRYINTCINMGIVVEPPHINQSGVDFTPLETSIFVWPIRRPQRRSRGDREYLNCPRGGEFLHFLG